MKHEQMIEIPNGAKILTLQIQIKEGQESEVPVTTETPCIWALVNTDAGMGKKKILMYATGKEVNTNKELIYIGSVQVLDGKEIYHVFEEK